MAAVESFVELLDQLAATGVTADHIHLSSCGANPAGFLLAAKLLGIDTPIVGIAPIAWDAKSIVQRCATDAALLLGVDAAISVDDVINDDRYIGAAYGEPTDGALEAIRLCARSEALILEPVYTGKAMAGLLDAVRKGVVGAGSSVVFVHTGGTPLVLAYRDEIFPTLEAAVPVA